MQGTQLPRIFIVLALLQSPPLVLSPQEPGQSL